MMNNSGSLILKKARWYLILLSIVVEFFMGEAAYATEDSLRYLRKWRFMIACLPIVSLALLVTAASKWPKASADDNTSYYEGQILRDRATKLEIRVENLNSEQTRQAKQLDSVVAATISVQSDVRIINQKLDLVGWLVGSAIVALLTASSVYFYNLKLRKKLAENDMMHQRRAKAAAAEYGDD